MYRISLLTRPFNTWTSQDIAAFCEHAPEIAADGDMAVKHPVLHEMACAFTEKKYGLCDRTN